MAFLSNNMAIYYIIAIILLFIFLEWEFRAKDRLKNLFIILLSSALFIWLDVGSFLLLLLFSTIIWAFIQRRINIKKKLYFVVLSLILMLIMIKDYKYIFMMDNPYIPLGVSYYFFRLISLIIDYTNRPGEFEDVEILDYYTYVFFFPIILAGPIQRFRDFKELEISYAGVNRIKVYSLLLAALLVKLTLVDGYFLNNVYIEQLNHLQEMIKEQTLNGFFMKASYFGLTAFIHAYLDLMLYTEMSKSFSKLLGFSHQENFNKPLLASNLSQFWQRWHMSLSNWTRDYIFFPSLIKTKKPWLSTYFSMFVIGIWHAATLNWILWSVLHGTGINAYAMIREKKWFKAIKENKWGNGVLRVSGNIITIYFVSIVFIMVAIHDMELVSNIYFYALKSLMN